MSQNGKGDKRRPMNISQEQYRNNHDAIFNSQSISVEYQLQPKYAICSEANTKGHWAVKARRVKNQRTAARDEIIVAMVGKKIDYAEITLTRLIGYRGKRYDSDNLQSAFKATRDGICDAIGIDDASEDLSWTYEQEKSKEKGVRIDIKFYER